MMLIFVIYIIVPAVVVKGQSGTSKPGPTCLLSDGRQTACNDPYFLYVSKGESGKRCWLNEQPISCTDPTYQKLSKGQSLKGKLCFVGEEAISCDHPLFNGVKPGETPSFGYKQTKNGPECHINNQVVSCGMQIFDKFFKAPTESPNTYHTEGNVVPNGYQSNLNYYPSENKPNQPTTESYQTIRSESPTANYYPVQQYQTSPQSSGYSTPLPSYPVSDRNRNSVNSYASTSKITPTCGLSKPSIKPLISSGQNASFGQFPWAAAIYDKTKSYMLICGGSIITPFTILSAAHCFYDEHSGKRNAEDYMISVGKVSRDYSVDDSPETKRYEVERIILEGFFGLQANFINDIAILQMKNEIKFTSFVYAVCIPPRGTIIKAGSLLSVFGWGLDENKVATPVLKTAKVPFYPYIDCLYHLSEDNRRLLSSDKYCIKHVKGIMLNEGDSGSGLTLQQQQTSLSSPHYIVGIVSFKESSLTSEVSVITNVLHYDNFLINSLKEIHEAKNYDISYLNL